MQNSLPSGSAITTHHPETFVPLVQLGGARGLQVGDVPPYR
jgi:hypothetical protein